MSILATILSAVRLHLAPLDLYAQYPAQVVAQNDDGTVEIKPTGARAATLLAGLSRVPIRGLPGVRVEVAQGARVLVGWEGGDATAPYAALAAPDSLKRLIIEAELEIELKAPSIVAAKVKGNARPVGASGDLVRGILVCGPPGTPVPFTGYLIGKDRVVKAE